MGDGLKRPGKLHGAGILRRREFLAAAAALGVSAAALRPASAQPSQPKRGGHLIIGVSQGSTSDTLDPASWVADYINTLGTQFYDTLTLADEHLQLQPSLAESWEPRQDAKVWVFKLRKGVTFHNGKTLTAADVVYSLNHHRGPTSKSAARAVVGSIADVAATGPNEVTVTLNSGNVDLPFLLADWHLGIVPEGSNFDGVGTGAFVLESFEPGVRALTKRNVNDWRQDRGYVNTVETVVINDPAARVSALLSGSAHVVNRVMPTSVELLKGNPKLQVFVVAGGTHAILEMLCDAPPFNNADLRLALKYAMDREAVVKTVLRGYGRLGNDHPIPSYDPMYAADIPQRQYDADRARFHFKKAGYDGPIKFVAADITFPGAIETAQLLQASAQKAGIDVQVDRVANDGFWDKYWQKVPFCGSNNGGRPTADMMLTAAFSSTSPINACHWRNEPFDRLLAAARSELDTTKRKAMYHDLQLMVRDDAGELMPMFSDTIDGGSKSIGGFVPSQFQQLCGYRAAEKVWFES